MDIEALVQADDKAAFDTAIASIRAKKLEEAAHAAEHRIEYLPAIFGHRFFGEYKMTKLLRHWLRNDGNPDAIRLVIEAGAEVEGMEDVAAAAEAGDLGRVRMLVGAGLPVDAVHHCTVTHSFHGSDYEGDGYNALVAAVVAGNAEMVSLLLELGADPNRVTWKQRKALDIAQTLEHDAVVAALQAGGAVGVTADDLSLFGAAKQGVLERVRALAPEASETDRGRAAWAASGEDHFEIATALVGFGIDDESMGHVLRTAASRGSLPLVNVCLDAGADVDASTAPSQYTALICAADKGHAAIVERLLAAGAKVDAASADGFTALHQACETGRAAIATLLVAAGADPDRSADDGNTPRGLATDSAVKSALPG